MGCWEFNLDWHQARQPLAAVLSHIFFPFGFCATYGGALGFLLTLHSEITSDGLRGPGGVLGQLCERHAPYPQYYFSGPVSFMFF